MNVKSLIPWHAKILAKLALSRLPARYALWHKLDLFSHGAMDQPDYAHEVFVTHYQRTQFGRKQGGYVALEFGPGDSALSALTTHAYGAAQCILVDAGSFAARDIEPYRRMAAYLADKRLPVPDLRSAGSLDDVLRSCHAQYHARGLQSLRELPSASVDFIWSQAVLEHVRREEFLATMVELRRVLRQDGACSHRVDLKDHLGGSLNNLRLSSRWWEKEWMARSGFYTNRLRLSEMLELFRRAGFACELLETRRWARSPIKRSQLAREFRDLSDDDLHVREFDVLLRPA
jgi:predicted SAM-dependent methyltransferase